MWRWVIVGGGWSALLKETKVTWHYIFGGGESLPSYDFIKWNQCDVVYRRLLARNERADWWRLLEGSYLLRNCWDSHWDLVIYHPIQMAAFDIAKDTSHHQSYNSFKPKITRQVFVNQAATESSLSCGYSCYFRSCLQHWLRDFETNTN